MKKEKQPECFAPSHQELYNQFCELFEKHGQTIQENNKILFKYPCIYLQNQKNIYIKCFSQNRNEFMTVVNFHNGHFFCDNSQEIVLQPKALKIIQENLESIDLSKQSGGDFFQQMIDQVDYSPIVWYNSYQ